jgi:hypothetical protein
MEANTKTKPLWLKILRWVARIIALLFIIFILAMFIGEGGFWSQPKGAPLGLRDYLLLSLFGLYVIGLIIGLWREGLGGLISLVFMAIHIIILSSEGIKHLTYFYAMLLPSLLYILSWYYHRLLARQQAQTGQ